jgi:heme exporter protein B
MLLLGSVLVFLLATQVDLPYDERLDAMGGLIWVAIAFAGTLAIESSMANESGGGWREFLALYPIPPYTMFLAKLVVNFALMLLLQLALAPLFVVVADVPLFSAPSAMMMLILLGSVGFAALGTILGALTAGLPSRSGMLALLLLPLLTPMLFGSAEATRIAMSDAKDPLLWWWIQLLAGFAFVFTTTGVLMFGFLARSEF